MPDPNDPTLVPYQDTLPSPNVVDLRTKEHGVRQTVTLKSAPVRFSQQLPETTGWTYDGTLPGPTFVVNKGQTVHMDWKNEISTPLPYRVAVCPDPADGDNDHIPQNHPGVPADGVANAKAAALQAATVTHLHGGRTAADSDGWTENVARHGETQHTTYGNDQTGTLLWYHDHGMGVTRLNVYAGLFGFWIIRDPREAALAGTLPSEADEIPLLIQDRNFDTDGAGNFTGALLHKTEATTAEMFGPYTLVNGTLWPRRDVAARPTRLRLLNGSNARTLCLRLLTVNDDGSYGDDVTDDAGLIWQIGTDGGLLDHPVALPQSDPKSGLLLAPAERADLVVNFGLHPGKKLALVNTAPAPFHGGGFIAAGQASPADRVPFPHVLRFDVGPDEGATAVLTGTTALDPNFKRYVHAAGDGGGHAEFLLPSHMHRWIALTEYPAGSLFFRELLPATTDPLVASLLPNAQPLSAIITTDNSGDAPVQRLAYAPALPLIALQGTDGTVTWYRTAAMSFHDTITIQIPYDGWEVWNLINLTGDTHPIHVHLVQFQALHRQAYAVDGYVDSGGYTLPGQPLTPSGGEIEMDANEQGFKDTVRVNPNEVLSIAAHFDGHCGRYMYHCHILEHEDHDMMRPFIVSPADALGMMTDDMGGMSGMGSMVM